MCKGTVKSERCFVKTCSDALYFELNTKFDIQDANNLTISVQETALCKKSYDVSKHNCAKN